MIFTFKSASITETLSKILHLKKKKNRHLGLFQFQSFQSSPADSCTVKPSPSSKLRWCDGAQRLTGFNLAYVCIRVSERRGRGGSVWRPGGWELWFNLKEQMVYCCWGKAFFSPYCECLHMFVAVRHREAPQRGVL